MRAAVLLAAVTALVVYRRKNRSLMVGWLWYLGTLVPVIGLVQVGVQASADRYTYIPFIGLFILLTWLVADLSARLPHRAAMLAAERCSFSRASRRRRFLKRDIG